MVTVGGEKSGGDGKVEKMREEGHERIDNRGEG